MIEKKSGETRIAVNDQTAIEEEEHRYSIMRELLEYINRGESVQAERYLYDNMKVLFPEEDHFTTAMRSVEYVTVAANQAFRDGISSRVLTQTVFDMRKAIRKKQTAREAREVCAQALRRIADMIRSFTDVKEDYSDQYSPAVLSCMDSIISHMPERRMVSELAEDVHLSPKYLSALFARETGKTISQFEQELSLREARFLLRNTDHSYSEISYMLNYSSQSYFNAVFKREVGMTPGQFRRMYKNQPHGLDEVPNPKMED